MSCCLKEIKEKSKNESAFNYYQKILTNILAALYKPFGFSCLLSFFALFFYLYAYYSSEAGKGWKAAIHTWFTAFKVSSFLESYSCLFCHLDDPVPDAIESGLVDESFVRCNGRLGHLGNGERRKTADDRVHRECNPDDAVHRDGDVDV